MDSYLDFNQLSKHERHGTDYKIVWKPGGSGILIAAPHGGNIEPGTSEIARAIAAQDHSFYAFEGIKAQGNRRLHITSTRFDEPTFLAQARASRLIITIHGCKGTEEVAYLGGLNYKLRHSLKKSLTGSGFLVTAHHSQSLQGTAKTNICNLGQHQKGVQIELSMGLRSMMFAGLGEEERKDPTSLFFQFVSAIRSLLKSHTV